MLALKAFFEVLTIIILFLLGIAFLAITGCSQSDATSPPIIDSNLQDYTAKKDAINKAHLEAVSKVKQIYYQRLIQSSISFNERRALIRERESYIKQLVAKRDTALTAAWTAYKEHTLKEVLPVRAGQ